MGDLSEGELEIGQVSALMDTIKPAAEIVLEIIEEFNLAKNKMSEMKF
jgi:enoyl-[acyl-carrier protein] reductase II